MRPMPEGEVEVWRAAKVEPVRVGELALVAVRRWVPQHDRVAGPDRRAVQVEVCGRRAGELDHRRRPPQQLLDGGLDHAVGIGREPVTLGRVFQQRLHATGDGIARRLVARRDQQDQVAVQLLIVERPIVDRGVHQDGR